MVLTKRCKVTRQDETRYHDVPNVGAKVGAYVEIRETDPYPEVQRIFWTIEEVEEPVLKDQSNG